MNELDILISILIVCVAFFACHFLFLDWFVVTLIRQDKPKQDKSWKPDIKANTPQYDKLETEINKERWRNYIREFPFLNVWVPKKRPEYGEE